eukprot:gene34952-42328_t
MTSWWRYWADRKAPSDSSSGGSNTSATTAIVIDLIKFGVLIGVSLYVSNELLKQLSTAFNALTSESDPKAALAAKQALAKKLGRPEIETMDFDGYELRIMPEVVGPEEITTGFSDVGGLDSAIDEVKDNVVLPIQIWKYHKSYASVSPCPTGVLLYGPPGTGKSLIAKAIAKEAGATFISIKASSVLDKFMGESEKLAQAIFKLGRKLAPSVIFIDEIETLLQKRRGDTHHAVSSLQGMFLSEWDGLTQQQQQKQSGSVVAQGPVVVLGATNRPSDLDAAFLRRMPVKLAISLPDTAARVAIFQAQLRHENVNEDVDLVHLAEQLEGSTGADIKEVIRLACLRRTKEISAQAQELLAQKSSELSSLSSLNRPINKEDFEFALNKILHSGSNLRSYSQQQQMSEMSVEEKFMRMMAR